MRGFSLLELAIVMVISGLMLVGVARLFETLQLKQALSATHRRIEKIQEQLDAFADKNERFPCPLPPAAAPGAPEPESCVDPNLKPGDRDVAMGILPAAALGLTPGEIEDGWGHMFTYAVSAQLTKTNGMRGVNPPPGVIGMVNGYGDNVLDTPGSGRYVIISHGPHGGGGFTPQGVEIPCRDGTLAAKNCHRQVDFVTSPWSTKPGPFFFDDIVAGDGSRRQARLLERLDFCGRLGKFYAPESSFLADEQGCVADDKLYGACTVESAYIDRGLLDALTGDWDELPNDEWKPAKADVYPPPPLPPAEGDCACEQGFAVLGIATGELPLPPDKPPPTRRDDCERAYAHDRLAVVGNDTCGATDPPALDMRERPWRYEYVATVEGKIWKEVGLAWKPDDMRGHQILPLVTRDPDDGRLVKARAAAHNKRDDFKVAHIEWTVPLRDVNHKMSLYTCRRR